MGEILIGNLDAAELLGVSRQTVDAYTRKGLLRVAKWESGARYYKRGDILKLKEARGEEGFRRGRRRRTFREG